MQVNIIGMMWDYLIYFIGIPVKLKDGFFEEGFVNLLC